MNELFRRRYDDVSPEMLLDFLQQAMSAMVSVTSHQLADDADRIDFTTSFTWTSWGENMVAVVEPDGDNAAVLVISGEPRVGMLSNPWGEEIHAATVEAQLFAALDPLVQTARSNPVAMLQADHRRVEALFLRIQASEGDQRAELVRQLLSALAVHMELEEKHVYPLIQREVDPELAEEAEVEHQLARDGLSQLEELSPDEAGFDGALAMVMAGIEHHVLEEEGEAFPRLATELGADGLADLAGTLVRVRSELLEQARRPQKESTSRASRPPRPRRDKAGDRGTSSRRRRRAIDPEATTRADLVRRARKAGVRGYSHMSKAELAKAVSAAG